MTITASLKASILLAQEAAWLDL